MISDRSFVWRKGKLDEGCTELNKPDRISRLHTDGGITKKGDDTIGAVGVILATPSGRIIEAFGRRLGWVQDHHVAEYQAVIEGMRLALGHRLKSLIIESDSKLVVQQLGGWADTKASHLIPMHAQASDLLGKFHRLQITHVGRRQNKGADALCNRALGR